MFTVKRDLTSISLFHARICNVLQTHPRCNISPPLFPDPFRIAAIEEVLTESSSVKSISSFSVKMMQTKLDRNLFGYSRTMREIYENMKGKETLGSKELDEVLDSIQEYFRGIFLLIEIIDPESSSHENLEQNADRFLRQKLGSLVGSFLTNNDREEKILNNFRNLEEIIKPPTLPDSMVDLAQPPSSTSTFLKENSINRTPVSSRNITSSLFTENDDERRSVCETGACWQPYVKGGLKTRLTFTDDHGGRLSLKSDDELLRVQRSRCMGCGEQLSVQWGFLGLDRNFQPCRYYGGLFCRKWCHAGDRRQIPNRLLLYWDHKAHRVSIQAARFLDDLWKKPLIHLKTANRLLYEGVPTLRLARNMRGRALSLIERVLESDLSDEQSIVKDAIVNTLGLHQVHLCLSNEIYSLSDLVRVQSGEALAAVELLITVLREKDYSLGIGSGPSHRQPSSPSKV